MKTGIIRQSIEANKPPLNIYTTDGRIIYIDHPESAIITEDVVAIGACMDGETGVFKNIVLLSPDHIVRIEPTRRKAMRKVA